MPDIFHDLFFCNHRRFFASLCVKDRSAKELMMEDRQIIDLYFARDEDALTRNIGLRSPITHR